MGVALDVVVVVCGDGGVGFLVNIGVRSVVVVVCSVLEDDEVVQFAGGENFSAKVVVCSVLDKVVCSVLVGVDVASLAHCCTVLAFNFLNCWVRWV